MANNNNDTIFTGAATAIITPFKDGKVDYDAFGKFVDWQIENEIDAIVVAGTTGETSALTDSEHRDLIKFCVEKVDGRVKVIAGTGSNDTNYAISLTKYASSVGVDGCLLVTPYYNKTSQDGLVASFSAIADNSDVPCILYNVASRTGINIEPETALRLADHPKITGIKEASGNLSQVAEIAQLCGDKLDIYSGNDDQVVPIMSLGGKGVISVLSNIMPKQTHKMCMDMLDGNWKDAKEAQLKYLTLINALFSEVNPIPVKAACAAMGFCENSPRLPLVCMNKNKEAALLEIMKQHDLIN